MSLRGRIVPKQFQNASVGGVMNRLPETSTDLTSGLTRSMKNVILLHGIFPERFDGKLIADIPLCDPNNEGNWMGWTKKRLQEAGYMVACPVVEDAWNATWQQWKEKLDETTIDEDTTLVGWSAGGYAVLRYLGESNKKVKKVILVAPGAPDIDSKEVVVRFPHQDDFYSYEITPSLKSLIRDQVVEFVSNDFDFILEAVEVYQTTLDAKVIRLEDRGHFSFLIPEFPELLSEIEESY